MLPAPLKRTDAASTRMVCRRSALYPSATVASQTAGVTMSQSPIRTCSVAASASSCPRERCATIRLSCVPRPKSITIASSAA